MINPFKKIAKAKEMFHKRGIYGAKMFFCFFDIMYCKKVFHATFEEYFYYEFHNKKNRVRKNYLLTCHQRAFYSLVNCDPTLKTMGKKNQYVFFNKELKREWIFVPDSNKDAVWQFIQRQGKVIFKPDHGSQGNGIFSFSADLQAQYDAVFEKAVKDNYICEQYVVQHPVMSKMNPSSVNTIRIITLRDGENAKIISAGLRTGAGTGVCDNMSAGGVGAAIDVNSGVVYTDGINFEKQHYEKHPASGVTIKGFEIPFWEDVKKLVIDCALRLDGLAVTGWDIAVTENGPCIIEVNNRPAAKLVQTATGKPQGEEIIRYIKKNRHKYYKRTPQFIKRQIKRFS